ncbi:Membrane steroid-binding protein 2 [Durusdinium trenchii]|uniref:Membrane steroid-binding protein 2 n=1 Tax=Durusdinium trenchii TaxID=1381693 RepID=A0ABP0Q7S9_9DINO
MSFSRTRSLAILVKASCQVFLDQGLGKKLKGMADQVRQPKVKAMPAALRRQLYNASGRLDETSSVGSWTRVDEEPRDPWEAPAFEPVQESAAEQTDAEASASAPAATPVQVTPPPPPAGGPPPSSSAAPVIQAAQSWLNHSNETPASRKLRRQQEQAARRGRRGIRWGNMAPANLRHNPLNTALPDHLSQIGSGEGERSILILDNRDMRIQSPFQNWLLDEVLTNALTYLNVKSDRNLVKSPSTGYHFNLFLVRTLDSVKVVICGSATCYTSVPCAKWDAMTGSVLSHSAFQPFRWPPMTENSPTWADVKIKLEGHLLVHLELRGYRSDADMSIQMIHIADAIHTILSDTVFIPSIVITVFQGWRVVAVSWEVGGRIYACSEGGIVVALDFPLCHFEYADRLEMRFWSASDRLDISANTASIPSSWLVISRVSGPTLIRNAKWCRDHGARVEGPDQALQFSQLAAIHAHWTAKIEASSIDDTGPRVSAIAVESNPVNVHLVCESPLFKKDRAIVHAEALALQCHDPLEEVVANILPPIVDGPAVQPVEDAPKLLPVLQGPSPAGCVPLAPVSSAKPSMTDPGQAPPPGSLTGGAMAPPRRSMEQRRSDPIDCSAMTPHAFVEAARGYGSNWPPASGPFPSRAHRQSSVQIDEINEISADQGPRSFAPARPGS